MALSPGVCWGKRSPLKRFSMKKTGFVVFLALLAAVGANAAGITFPKIDRRPAAADFRPMRRALRHAHFNPQSSRLTVTPSLEQASTNHCLPTYYSQLATLIFFLFFFFFFCSFTRSVTYVATRAGHLQCKANDQLLSLHITLQWYLLFLHVMFHDSCLSRGR